jgi:hypothetical protein
MKPSILIPALVWLVFSLGNTSPTFANTLPGKPSDCIDSIHTSVQDVSCFGLRDGAIQIDSVFGGQPPFYYSIDGITFSTHPVFDRLWHGEYQLWIRDALGCERKLFVLVTEPDPIDIYLVASDTVVPSGTPIHLEIKGWPDSLAIGQIQWRPPALFDTQQRMEQSVSLSESVTIAAIVTDLNGCNSTALMDLEIEKVKIYTPNVLKPSVAEEAYFTIFSENSLDRIKYLRVFSRNGSMIFEQSNFPVNNPADGWDGKWQGSLVPPGVYSWTAMIEFADGHIEQQQGSITVIR